MYEAARLHDGIEHTHALAGFLAGAALGLAMFAAGALLMLAGPVGWAMLACASQALR